MPKPEDYELITTLWFNSDNISNSNFDSEESSKLNICPLYNMSSSKCVFAPIGDQFKLIYQNNSSSSEINKRKYFDSLLINIPYGSVNSTPSFYYNDYYNYEDDCQLYTVNDGNGIFKNASIILITFDDKGVKFGYKNSRRVEIFKLKNVYNNIKEINKDSINTKENDVSEKENDSINTKEKELGEKENESINTNENELIEKD